MFDNNILVKESLSKNIAGQASAKLNEKNKKPLLRNVLDCSLDSGVDLVPQLWHVQHNRKYWTHHRMGSDGRRHNLCAISKFESPKNDSL